MKRALTLAAACAAFALPASLAAAPETAKPETQTEAKAEQDEGAKKESEEDRKICRRIKEVGTRFSEKVCMTKEQWRAQRTGAQESVREERKR